MIYPSASFYHATSAKESALRLLHHLKLFCQFLQSFVHCLMAPTSHLPAKQSDGHQ